MKTAFIGLTILFGSLTADSAWSSGHGLNEANRFVFLSPGVTVTGGGPGLEFSVGQNGFESAHILTAGALAQYEFRKRRFNLGGEAGYLFFQTELSYSFSESGNSVLWVPSLCIPIPLDMTHGFAVNFFYRAYLQRSGENSVGGSFKFAFLKI
jgi:hypothetical protein